MKRDSSLLLVLVLLIGSAATAVIHHYRVIGWIENWDHDRGSTELEHCYDCYAYQFYLGDWYQFAAIAFFLISFGLVFRSWLRSCK